ncbi:NAD(P) transhydrogenase beta subunit [Paraburkholderia sp. RAU2J]|uniref:NAD(P)(+) transhydrogenase (Re/Si-specific) subunit beta n=1 Tax=Paraburkholderia sp. RAU2J TaxID=1938810 RepID=UPI000EB5AF38|nr:NAD(P)(+) transhydrogenase (Re/Si-specific) subunit beta [Paraburkholderia sp. RAU2J]RKT21069.1 NAD(P) transhydrogenase beta subunit [Paraburkholderia sp. RAU2J]
MLQASDSTAWMSVCFSLAAALGAALISVLTVALAAVGQRQLEMRATRRPYWHAAALAAVFTGLFAAGMGASGAVVDAALLGAVLGAWLVRGCDLTRRPRLVALLGSGMGLAVMSGGIVRYLSTDARESAERIELYAAVFMGALIFATSAIAFCKLRGALQLSTIARPGHRIVNLIAMVLCGWLGYGFATEQAQPFGLAALLEMSALACAMGAHLMISREISREYCAGHGAGRAVHAHAFAARCDGVDTGKGGLLARIEWHGGEEQAWALRDMAPGTIRTAAYRRRASRHHSGRANRRQRECIRHRPSHFTARH